MTVTIGRRELLAALGGAAAGWPLTAGAQQPGKLPTIGFLGNDAATWTDWTAAFRQGLKKAGYVEGQNATIEYRWAEGHYDRLPGLAADLVGRKVTVIAATSTPAALAAKAATATVPIVFTTGGDPIKLGLVASLNRPGGNITGVSSLISELGTKRLGLLRELIPSATVIATLVNPNFPDADGQLRDAEAGARALGLQLIVLRAGTEREIDAAFATMAQRGGGVLDVSVDPFFVERRDHIVALAASYAIPAMYPVRVFAVAGGLMSYGTDFADSYRHRSFITLLGGAVAAWPRAARAQQPNDPPRRPAIASNWGPRGRAPWRS